jgi:hypothetical protein
MNSRRFIRSPQSEFHFKQFTRRCRFGRILSHRHPRRAIFGTHSSPQGDVELMAEKKVLDFKPAWWLEQIGYEGCKQVDGRKLRIG